MVKKRCGWVGADSPLMLEYHDREWGVPVHDDVKHWQKIEAAVRNARALLAIQEEFGSFDAYSWRFVGGQPKVNRWKIMKQIPATSAESDSFSKDLKQRGLPKTDGGTRRLSIPTIRDRVVQGALKLILEPIFEADFQPGS